jgi:hypothetical protein
MASIWSATHLTFFDEKNRGAEAEVLVFLAVVEDDCSGGATARSGRWFSVAFLR